MRSTAATRAETIKTIVSGEPIDAALAGRRLGYELDRQHIAVIAWLQAHEEGQDTHGALEAAVAVVRERLGAPRALIHPLGTLSTAAWIGTHDTVPSGRLDELRFDTQTAPGVLIAIGESGHGIGGFRRSHTEAVEARRVAELAGRPPGTITRYSRVALAAMATADLEQARTFVQRELRGLAGDDDLTARLAATLAHLSRRARQPQPHRQAARHPREHRQLPDQAGGGDPRSQRRSAHARAARRACTCAARPCAAKLSQPLSQSYNRGPSARR